MLLSTQAGRISYENDSSIAARACSRIFLLKALRGEGGWRRWIRDFHASVFRLREFVGARLSFEAEANARFRWKVNDESRRGIFCSRKLTHHRRLGPIRRPYCISSP